MNTSFLLVLSIFIQYILVFFIQLIFPSPANPVWFTLIRSAFLSVMAVFLPAYFYLKKEKKSYFSDCFLNVKPSVLMLLSFLIGMCTQYVGIAINLPVKYGLYLLTDKLPENSLAVSNIPLFIATTVVICLIPAIFEEVMFRGIIFNYFRQYGEKAAIVVSAILFAVMHLDYGNTMGTFALGIVAGLLVKHTNRLIYPMIAHFAMNLVSVTVSYISEFEMIMGVYNDIFYMFILVSIPLIIYLLRLFKNNSIPLPYADTDKHNLVHEEIIEIDEENSIRIFEHDVKENNLKMAFSDLFSSPYTYIFLILYLYIGGTKLL